MVWLGKVRIGRVRLGRVRLGKVWNPRLSRLGKVRNYTVVWQDGARKS